MKTRHRDFRSKSFQGMFNNNICNEKNLFSLPNTIDSFARNNTKRKKIFFFLFFQCLLCYVYIFFTRGHKAERLGGVFFIYLLFSNCFLRRINEHIIRVLNDIPERFAEISRLVTANIFSHLFIKHKCTYIH